MKSYYLVFQDGEGFLVKQDGKVRRCTLHVHEATRFTMAEAIEEVKNQVLPQLHHIFEY